MTLFFTAVLFAVGSTLANSEESSVEYELQLASAIDTTGGDTTLPADSVGCSVYPCIFLDSIGIGCIDTNAFGAICLYNSSSDCPIYTFYTDLFDGVTNISYSWTVLQGDATIVGSSTNQKVNVRYCGSPGDCIILGVFAVDRYFNSSKCCTKTFCFDTCGASAPDPCLSTSVNNPFCAGPVKCDCDDVRGNFRVNICDSDSLSVDGFDLCYVDWKIDSPNTLSWVCCDSAVEYGVRRDFDMTSPLVYPCIIGNYEISVEVCFSNTCGDTILLRDTINGVVPECSGCGGGGIGGRIGDIGDDPSESEFYKSLINENGDLESIRIRPNPLTQESMILHISAESSTEASVKIYTLEGRLVDIPVGSILIVEGESQFTVTSNKLHSNTYYILVVESNGGSLGASTFLKQ